MDSYLKALESGFLAHFSRRLSTLIIEQATEILEQREITTPVTAISYVFFLVDRNEVTVSEIAEALEITHQMATQRTNTLEKLGLVCRKLSADDKRARTIHLTKLGMEEEKRLRPIMKDTNMIFDLLNEQIGCELMTKIREAELALKDKTLKERLNEIA